MLTRDRCCVYSRADITTSTALSTIKPSPPYHLSPYAISPNECPYVCTYIHVYNCTMFHVTYFINKLKIHLQLEWFLFLKIKAMR